MLQASFNRFTYYNNGAVFRQRTTAVSCVGVCTSVGRWPLYLLAPSQKNTQVDFRRLSTRTANRQAQRGYLLFRAGPYWPSLAPPASRRETDTSRVVISPPILRFVAGSRYSAKILALCTLVWWENSSNSA